MWRHTEDEYFAYGHGIESKLMGTDGSVLGDIGSGEVVVLDYTLNVLASSRSNLKSKAPWRGGGTGRNHCHQAEEPTPEPHYHCHGLRSSDAPGDWH